MYILDDVGECGGGGGGGGQKECAHIAIMIITDMVLTFSTVTP